MSKKAALNIAESLETYRKLKKMPYDTDEVVLAEFLKDLWSYCDSRDIHLSNFTHQAEVNRERDLVSKGLL